jgi:hypothetical protein
MTGDVMVKDGKEVNERAGAAPALLENQCVGQAELVIDVSNLI